MIFVYKTMNMVNGKYYFGVHKTNNPNDSYLGSGKRLCRAIEKYGKDFFKREIVSVHSTYTSALSEERRLVSLVLGHSDCYNLCDGGGMPPKWDGENHPMFGKKRPEHAERMRRHNPMHGPAKLSNVRKVIVRDSNGNRLKISLDDIRWKTGELVPINKGRKQLPRTQINNPATFKGLECPHCHKIGNGIAMRRWHFDYCRIRQMEGSV